MIFTLSKGDTFVAFGTKGINWGTMEKEMPFTCVMNIVSVLYLMCSPVTCSRDGDGMEGLRSSTTPSFKRWISDVLSLTRLVCILT